MKPRTGKIIINVVATFCWAVGDMALMMEGVKLESIGLFVTGFIGVSLLAIALFTDKLDA